MVNFTVPLQELLMLTGITLSSLASRLLLKKFLVRSRSKRLEKETFC